VTKTISKTLSLKIFDPTRFSDEKQMRLDSLLDSLDMAVEERKKYLSVGYLKALKEFLKDPSANEIIHDYLSIFNVIPEDRWLLLVEEMERGASDGTSDSVDAIAQLKSLDAPEQKEAVSFMLVQYAQFVDESRDREHWQKLDGLYKIILSEFPDILFNADDIMGAARLGTILDKNKDSLSAVWKTNAAGKKIETSKSLLTLAYPDDDIAHLHVASVEVKNVAAAFHTSLPVDTMVCGSLFLNSTRWVLPLFLMTHEFQHRRQLRLVDRLKKDQLTKGSAEYYQARLFRANFDGGYLSSTLATNKVAMYAKLTAYYEQPVEQQANDNTRLASIIGNTGGDVIWSLSEKFTKAVSAIARPVDKISYESRRVISAITSIGHRKP